MNPEKGNQHKKLYRPDYFAWKYYCPRAKRLQKKLDKQAAKKAARQERKAAVTKGEY